MNGQKNTLDQTIEQAKKAEGYMISVTRRNGDKLSHDNFTFNFLRADIFPTLEEWAKGLEAETKEPQASTKEGETGETKSTKPEQKVKVESDGEPVLEAIDNSGKSQLKVESDDKKEFPG